MTVQQLYDTALEEGALNYDITLYLLPLRERDFKIDHKKHTVDIET